MTVKCVALGGIVFNKVCGLGTIGVSIVVIELIALRSCTMRYTTGCPFWGFFSTGKRGVLQGNLLSSITPNLSQTQGILLSLRQGAARFDITWAGDTGIRPTSILLDAHNCEGTWASMSEYCARFSVFEGKEGNTKKAQSVCRCSSESGIVTVTPSGVYWMVVSMAPSLPAPNRFTGQLSDTRTCVNTCLVSFILTFMALVRYKTVGCPDRPIPVTSSSVSSWGSNWAFLNTVRAAPVSTKHDSLSPLGSVSVTSVLGPGEL